MSRSGFMLKGVTSGRFVQILIRSAALTRTTTVPTAEPLSGQAQTREEGNGCTRYCTSCDGLHQQCPQRRPYRPHPNCDWKQERVPHTVDAPVAAISLVWRGRLCRRATDYKIAFALLDESAKAAETLLHQVQRPCDRLRLCCGCLRRRTQLRWRVAPSGCAWH